MDIEKNEILNVLKTIIHPSIGKDILSIGYVKDLSLTGNKLSFILSFPSFNDPLKSSLKRACEITLKEKFSDNLEIDIKIEANIKPIQPKVEEKPLSDVKNIIAVASGKGGVGKSTSPRSVRANRVPDPGPKSPPT